MHQKIKKKNWAQNSCCSNHDSADSYPCFTTASSIIIIVIIVMVVLGKKSRKEVSDDDGIQKEIHDGEWDEWNGWPLRWVRFDFKKILLTKNTTWHVVLQTKTPLHGTKRWSRILNVWCLMWAIFWGSNSFSGGDHVIQGPAYLISD